MTHTHVVYLLHFEPPLGRAAHYVGITRANRLQERLTEHAAMRGAAITKAALASGSVVTLARFWPVSGFDAERLIKNKGHYREQCPVCITGKPAANCTAFPRLIAAPASAAPPVHTQLSW